MTIIGSPWMVLVDQFCECGEQLKARTRFDKTAHGVPYDIIWYWQCPKCFNEYELLIDKKTHESLVGSKK